MGGRLMQDRNKLLQKLIKQVDDYISQLENKHHLSDKEILRILDAVRENYEWED
jgi:hypothetical protein